MGLFRWITKPLVDILQAMKQPPVVKEVIRVGAYCEGSRENTLIEKYKNIKPEEVIFDSSISVDEKLTILVEVYGYDSEEAFELIKTADKELQRAKLKGIKRKIAQKAIEQYGDIPADDRQPIPDNVKTYVWQRDKGKCVKCGGNEKLEFDHIIPFSKGGSNTERNLQLLCEKCNREKSNII